MQGSAADMKLIAYDELPAMPWKNGGGITRELACRPTGASLDDFVWRVSIADVCQSGPFSIFPGIDRIITLLEGDGMHLQFAQGGTHALTGALEPYRFRGEENLGAHLVGSPSRDFNLMVRRDAARGEIEVRRISGTISTNAHAYNRTTLLLFCACGSWRVVGADGPEQILRSGDSLLLEDQAGEVAIRPQHADSALLCLRITPLQTNP